MISLAIWVDKAYDNDKLFEKNSLLNRDNCLAPFHHLKDKIEEAGGACHTQDIFQMQDSIPDAVVFLDIPQKPVSQFLGNWDGNTRKYVILQECEVVIPRNWDIKMHEQFDKIFTWHDQFVDDNKYIKLNFSQNISHSIHKDPSLKKKMCTMIAGNKQADHPLELYSKRLEAILWFEKNAPDDFDLYGMKWDTYELAGIKLPYKFGRFAPTKYLTQPQFPTYRGSVKVKKEVLERYKFAICYENARDIPGYITEKIFDCFMAGCIPVYWGANNVTKYIPPECFIDRKDFSSYEELYQFLRKLTSHEVEEYLSNIECFLKGNKAKMFSSEHFSDVIIQHIGVSD